MIGLREYLKLRRRARIVAEIRDNADAMFWHQLATDIRAERRYPFLKQLPDLWERRRVAMVMDALAFWDRYSGGPSLYGGLYGKGIGPLQWGNWHGHDGTITPPLEPGSLMFDYGLGLL